MNMATSWMATQTLKGNMHYELLPNGWLPQTLKDKMRYELPTNGWLIQTLKSR